MSVGSEARSKRGTCSECCYRFALRKDGTLQAHRIYFGSRAAQCGGAGKPPLGFSPFDIDPVAWICQVKRKGSWVNDLVTDNRGVLSAWEQQQHGTEGAVWRVRSLTDRTSRVAEADEGEG